MAIINGTPGNNNLAGTAQADEIYGYEGNDLLFGSGGADLLVGGLGDDVYVIDALDTLVENANEGTDEVRSPTGFTLGAHFENLRLTGNAASNGAGNGANNSIWGNSANNVLDGAGGVDLLVGGLGNDTYITDGGDNLVENANQGTDEVRASVSFTLNTHFENLTLTGSDAINGYGNSANNVIAGNAGDNVLDGGAGIDTLQMTRAQLNVGPIEVNLGAGWASGHGTDTLLNFENVRGTEGNDLITGNAGANLLEGGNGHDEFFATLGIDIIQGGAGADAIRFDHTGAAQVNLASGSYWLSNANNGTVHSVDHVVGSAFNDQIIGNSAVNHISGGAGSDTILGGDGADQLWGGAGSDRLVADGGADTLVGNSDMHSATADAAADTFEIRPSASQVLISDFQPGVDKIDLTQLGLNSSNPTWTAVGNYQPSQTVLTLTPSVGQPVTVTLQGVTTSTPLSAADFVGGNASVVPQLPNGPVNGGNGVADVFVIDPWAVLNQNNGELNLFGFEDGMDVIDLRALGLDTPTAYWGGWVYDYGPQDQTRMEFWGQNNEFIAINLVGHSYFQVDAADFML